MTTFTDATPMVTVHAAHHNDLDAAVDNLQGLVGNSVLSGTWRWTSSTTDASASGRVGINQATWAATTQLNLNETTLAGGDTTNVLAKLKAGDGFYLQDHTDASRWARYTISGTQADQGTWRQFPVTFADASEPPPQNNADTVVTLTVQGGTSAALDTKVDEDSVTAAATRVVQNMLAAGDAQPAWQVLGSGEMNWGPGGATAPDTTLYRWTAGALGLGTSVAPGRLNVFAASIGDIVFSTRVGADTNDRARITGAGAFIFGDGTAAPDVSFGRLSAGRLNADSGYRSTRAFTTSGAFEANVTGNAQSRLIIRADGQIAWGDGTATQDTVLRRGGAAQLNTDGAFVVGAISQGVLYLQNGGYVNTRYAAGSGSAVFVSRVSTDTADRFLLSAGGTMTWGDGTAAQDTILQRSAADRLTTPDHFAATTMGLATKVKAGTPVDADWTVAPPDGTIVADSTGNKLWVRVGGLWKGATIA